MWHFVQTSLGSFSNTAFDSGILRLPMQSFGFALRMCFWRNLQSLINMLRLIGVHRLAFFDCFASSEHVYGPQEYHQYYWSDHFFDTLILSQS